MHNVAAREAVVADVEGLHAQVLLAPVLEPPPFFFFRIRQNLRRNWKTNLINFERSSLLRAGASSVLHQSVKIASVVEYGHKTERSAGQEQIQITNDWYIKRVHKQLRWVLCLTIETEVEFIKESSVYDFDCRTAKLAPSQPSTSRREHARPRCAPCSGFPTFSAFSSQEVHEIKTLYRRFFFQESFARCA